MEKPVWPEAANTHDEAGAIAFAKYYLELSKWSSSVGSGEEMAALSGPQCTSCQDYINGLTARVEAGGKFTGGRITFPNPGTEKATPKGLGFVVVLDVQEEPAAILDKIGSTVRFTQQSASIIAMGVFPADGGWQVTEITGVKK